VGATTETYTYAGDGVRLSASTGALANQTTKFLWDRNFGLPQVAMERDGSDALLRYYRFGLDLLRQTAGATTYYYHHDGLGSVGDVSSSAGASLSWGEYYPYGLARQAGTGAGAPAVQPFGFTGEQRDAVTNLYHLRARQYDPGTGRFFSEDPVQASIQRPCSSPYEYARNNPLVNVDPSGKESCPAAVLAGALLFGALGFADMALAIATTAVAPTVVGELIMLPADAAALFATSQAAGLAIQGANEPCDEIGLWNPFASDPESPPAPQSSEPILGPFPWQQIQLQSQGPGFGQSLK
jgi:RHS repeat-associated protein